MQRLISCITRILISFLMLLYSEVYATSVSLGHVTIMDPILGPRDIVYEKQDGYAVAEGDIILQKLPTTVEKNEVTPHALILLKLGGIRWPQGIVPFELSEDFSLSNKMAILDAVKAWQQNTHLKFIEITNQNHDDYTDYLHFDPTNGNTCSSYVGKQGGAQIIKLSPRCGVMSIAHEIGHALGLWHEQSRSDRDAYIKIIWNNIDENYRYNFNQHLTDGQDFGDYDYQSIMHYTAYAFSKNGEKTILPLQDGVEIGQRDHLSNKDIAAVNAMYP